MLVHIRRGTRCGWGIWPAAATYKAYSSVCDARSPGVRGVGGPPSLSVRIVGTSPPLCGCQRNDGPHFSLVLGNGVRAGMWSSHRSASSLRRPLTSVQLSQIVYEWVHASMFTRRHTRTHAPGLRTCRSHCHTHRSHVLLHAHTQPDRHT